MSIARNDATGVTYRPNHDDILEAYEALTARGFQVVPCNGKELAATGVTGKSGEVRSVKPKQGQNIAIRLPDTLVGIDVDAYGDKTGDETLKTLLGSLGKLPLTDRSSSREFPSGILVFRVPAGYRYITGWSNIDIVQHGHRYMLVEPSVHPDTGETYAWNTAFEKPLWNEGPAAFPELPKSWLNAIVTTAADAPQKSDTVNDEALTEGEPCDEVTAALESFRWKLGKGYSRHDSMVGTQYRLVQLGGQGHKGVNTAMDTLESMFLDAIGNDRDVSKEWNDAIEGALRMVDGTAETDPCDDDPFTLPNRFWESRTELQHIRQAAHSRGSSADVVFHALLARMSAMIDHRIRVDTGVLSPASLNYFAIVLGESGTGKTSGVNGALQELMPRPEHREGFQDGRILGSGEGTVELFMGKKWTKTDKVDKNGAPVWEKQRQQVRHNVFAHVDEGEQLVATLDRNGATLGPILRSAWIGTHLGMSNASEDTTRHLEAGSYALGIVMGFQPSTVAPLLGDSGSGMAQRFSWVHAEDKSIPYERIPHPGPLEGYILDNEPFVASCVNKDGSERVPVIDYAESLKDKTYRERVDANRGIRPDDFDEYDSHKPLTLAKVSGLLAMLNGRLDVTEDDYALAEIVWETSKAVRNRARETERIERWKEQERRNDEVVRLEARKEAARNQSSDIVKEVADFIVAKIKDKGTMNRSELRKTVSPKKRAFFDFAMDAAVNEGRLKLDGSQVSSGK